MARRLRIGPQHEEDLEAICLIGENGLKTVLNKLVSLDSPIIAASELRSKISECLQNDNYALPLARQLISLATYCRRQNEQPSEAVSSLLNGLEKSEISAENKEILNKIAPLIVKLISQSSVVLSSKALHLGFDYDRIYSSGNIITDIRPVFDEETGNISGAVVSQILRLQFGSGGDQQDISIALDKDDILELRDACENAIEKAKKAKALALDKMTIKAFVVGEETYGYG